MFPRRSLPSVFSISLQQGGGLGGEEGMRRSGRGVGLTSRNTLDAATTGQTPNGGLRDALDVVAEDLAVALCAAFAKPFTAFSA